MKSGNELTIVKVNYIDSKIVSRRGRFYNYLYEK